MFGVNLGSSADHMRTIRNVAVSGDGSLLPIPKYIVDYDILDPENQRDLAATLQTQGRPAWWIPDLETMVAERQLTPLRALAELQIPVHPMTLAQAKDYSLLKNDDEMFQILSKLAVPKLQRTETDDETRSQMNELLRMGCQEGFESGIAMALRQGADPNVIYGSGQTPLSILAQQAEPCTRCILTLQGHGADINAHDGLALRTALSRCKSNIVTLLLALGAKPIIHEAKHILSRCSPRKRERIMSILNRYDVDRRQATKRLARFIEPWVEHVLYRPGEPTLGEKPGIRVRRVASTPFWEEHDRLVNLRSQQLAAESGAAEQTQHEPNPTSKSNLSHAAFAYASSIVTLPAPYLRCKKVARDLGYNGENSHKKMVDYVAHKTGSHPADVTSAGL